PDGRTIELAYDPFGRRMLKQVFAAPGVGERRGGLVESTRFVWDGDELVHEIRTRANESGDPVVEERTYVFNDEGFVPIVQRDSAPGEEPRLWHYITDPAGAPEQLVDSAGRVACTLERTVWGAAVPSAGSVASTPLRFQGQYADDETGLHYNR